MPQRPQMLEISPYYERLKGRIERQEEIIRNNPELANEAYDYIMDTNIIGSRFFARSIGISGRAFTPERIRCVRAATTLYFLENSDNRHN